MAAAGWEAHRMQIRVVSDQPWDVVADVLAVPFVGEARLEGELGEIDRRSGGELRARTEFGELRCDKYAASLVSPGELKAGRLLAVGAGPAEQLNRQVTVRIGASIERR